MFARSSTRRSSVVVSGVGGPDGRASAAAADARRLTLLPVERLLARQRRHSLREGARAAEVDEDFAVTNHRMLGLPVPIYQHHRLITDESGRKLAKSARDTSLRNLREQGATPVDVRRLIGLD